MKLVALLLFCSVLCLPPGNCSRDRITISQFLSFLHKVSELFDILRKKYESDELVPFKFAYVYQTYQVMHLYPELPVVYRDWLKHFHVASKPTTPPHSLMNPTIETSPRSTLTAIYTTKRESRQTSPTEETTEESTTDDFFSEDFTATSTKDMPTKGPTSEDTPTTSSPTEISREEEMKSETPFPKTVSTTCTLPASMMPVKRRTASKRVVRERDDEDKDARRVVKVLNEITEFASKWGGPISTFKSRLQYFEKTLTNGRFASKTSERRKARQFTAIIRGANRAFRANMKKIQKKISNYTNQAVDATDLKNIEILMKTISELPQVLTQSLVG
ncbi:uncharacterized protein LOC119660007 [Hermetia illucens]|uniref:uncharacterized protein LOC119660007 n=1 Tax=Hermetia illucens TaxID=343691 RepID=UPI0018CC5B90|nr:uncharacterized protein LOC119660007 [Hermetia illucens]